uniref:Uncharacterized protein n=1 Tax=Candidatus Kentrum sp. LFY TaxID=2126342 RepID=A0A450UFE5_9GAMM|nr:MAG: hypothetical protein BECKLFY1418B_GA0070995_10258 [Candidatus Kentron sp. LFY]
MDKLGKEEKREELFQYDSDGEWDYLEDNHSTIRVRHDCLLLSLEGKIPMEEHGRQFIFLKYAMAQAFKQFPFPLAGALRIYITG